MFAEDVHGLPIVPVLFHVDLQNKQRADPGLHEIIYQLETGEKVPPTARKEIPELPFLLRELNKLELIDGILYRKRHGNTHPSYQLVLPDEL